jgi:phasin family protein
MTQNYETFATANKDVVDSFTQFNTLLAEGFKEISSHILASAQSTIEMNLATGKAVFGIKTPQELAVLQSNWTRQFFNAALSGSRKFSEISARIFTQTAAPIHAHISTTINKMTDGIFNTTAKAA